MIVPGFGSAFFFLEFLDDPVDVGVVLGLGGCNRRGFIYFAGEFLPGVELPHHGIEDKVLRDILDVIEDGPFLLPR